MQIGTRFAITQESSGHEAFKQAVVEADAGADKITIGKLNIDENPQIPANFDVMSIPTLIVFQNGVEKKRIVGAKPKHMLEKELAEFL